MDDSSFPESALTTSKWNHSHYIEQFVHHCLWLDGKTIDVAGTENQPTTLELWKVHNAQVILDGHASYFNFAVFSTFKL